MLGEWYLPPGKCQVIWTITEGTISTSHPAILSASTRIFQTRSLQTHSVHAPQSAPRPRSGVLSLEGTRICKRFVPPSSLYARAGRTAFVPCSETGLRCPTRERRNPSSRRPVPRPRAGVPAAKRKHPGLFRGVIRLRVQFKNVGLRTPREKDSLAACPARQITVIPVPGTQKGRDYRMTGSGCERTFKPWSHRDQSFLSLVTDDRIRAAGFQALHECSKLQCQKSIFRTGTTEHRQERLGADQYGLGLAVDCHNTTCIGVFQVLENFGQITVQFTTSNETNTRLRHQGPRGRNRPGQENSRRSDGSRLGSDRCNKE